MFRCEFLLKKIFSYREYYLQQKTLRCKYLRMRQEGRPL